ncbi:hypothetical protein CGMCC3_g14510 [Colletotrichum fructicola]|nr:uncharacterized protein CGMCC3_g14510 [Colletotrichum fructicola]KAE9569388.1 hypothetical protein CGMCC3_g14510 [Colletotrichum fructicola]
MPSIKALRAAAEDGCHLCALLLDNFKHSIFGDRSRPPRVLPESAVEIRWYPDVRIGIGNDRATYCCLAAFLLTNPSLFQVPFHFTQYEGGISSILTSKAAKSSWATGTDDDFRLAASWAKRCLATHPSCSLVTNPLAPLPSRVLDVMAKSCPSGLRLVDGAGRFGPYITLSHCWGKSTIITTKQATITQRRQYVLLEDLSQTFRDAVISSRALGIRYLWIDSLCIIQDSKDDWEFEAKRMCQYYTNSLMTISGVSSSGGEGGLFATRHPGLTSPIPTEITFPEDGKMKGFAHALYFPDPARDIWGDHKPPLWTRAWVVQERVLSPRLLLFSLTQMSWQCQEEIASENIPEGRPLESSREDKDMRWSIMGWQRAQSTSQIGEDLYSSPVASHRLYHGWYEIVREYTHCKLTMPSDIFHAVAGIMQALQFALKDEYVSGLWKGDIHRGLIWVVAEGVKTQRELRSYRAPSWSWGSLPGACRFVLSNAPREFIDTRWLDILGIEALSQDEPRPLLRVRGRLRKAYYVPYVEYDFQKHLPAKLKRGDDLVDAETGESLGAVTIDNNELSLLVELWCLPVCIVRSNVPGHVRKRTAVGYLEYSCLGKHRNMKSPPVWIEGLALQCLDKEKHVYMRVGKWRCEDLKLFRWSRSRALSII